MTTSHMNKDDWYYKVPETILCFPEGADLMS